MAKHMSRNEAVIVLMDEARREKFPGKTRCARLARAFKTLDFGKDDVRHFARYLGITDRDGEVSGLLYDAIAKKGFV